MNYPRDRLENLRYRKALREWAANSTKRQREIITRCRDGAEGFLYWVNSFCWLFEPRPRREDGKRMPSILPFITWPHQDAAAQILFDKEQGIGFADIGIEKSRGEGASWLVLMAFLHQFLFEEMQCFGLVSRNEDAVDKPDDPDTLMWKLDWELDRLPNWMRPRVRRLQRDHVLMNLDNKSTIIGYAAVADLASGGRKTAFLLDEYAKFPRAKGADEAAMTSTEPVTESRVIVSTPKGASGAYFKAMREIRHKIRLHWTDNPTRNRGLYKVVNGEPVAVDPINNPLPPGYVEEWQRRIRKMLEERGYDVQKGLRSPWYDQRCLRPRATPLSIAQEYDIDYQGSASKAFSVALIERLLRETARPELVRGELHFNTEDFAPKWVENPAGRLRLWTTIDVHRQRPASKPYVVGADVSAGQGGSMSSNSVLSIAERDTGIKVGEFTTPSLPPEQFANYAIAVCKWFRNEEEDADAYLIWEDNGCGGNFRNQIIRMGFRHFYLRTVEDEVSRRKTKKPGFRTGLSTKRSLFGDYQYALQTGQFSNPSKEALEECLEYENSSGGSIEFVGGSADEDPEGSKHIHGDRVIADAVTWHAAQEFHRARPGGESSHKPTSTTIKPNTFAWRQQQFRQAQEKSAYW